MNSAEDRKLYLHSESLYGKKNNIDFDIIGFKMEK
jgi:hypothetical protein